MINISNMPRAYSEVYEFINALGDEYKEKIPQSLYMKLENKRDKSYVPKYDINQENLDFSNEALTLIASINLQYWCEDKEEKERLKRIYIKNQEIQEEKYSYDNLFKNNEIKKEEETEEQINENIQMIEYKEENIFVKIFNKIKSYFKKK